MNSWIVFLTLALSSTWSTLTAATPTLGPELELRAWLGKAGLMELHPLLLAEGIHGPQDLLLLNDADLADFARRHSLRLGARAALRLAIQKEMEEQSDAPQHKPQHSNELAGVGATLTPPNANAVDKEVLLSGKIVGDPLAGCLASAGCKVELGACLASPLCKTKAGASALSMGAPSFEVFSSKEALVGAITAMALPLSLTPGGASLATCLMAQTDALTTCMAASAHHMQPSTVAEVSPQIIEV